VESFEFCAPSDKTCRTYFSLGPIRCVTDREAKYFIVLVRGREEPLNGLIKSFADFKGARVIFPSALFLHTCRYSYLYDTRRILVIVCSIIFNIPRLDVWSVSFISRDMGTARTMRE
jgi:hypothetical protein